MRKLLISCLLAVCVIPALADEKPQTGEQQVTLSVPGMVCPACPVTVKKGLEKVDGVVAVDVNYEEKVALVTYDSARVTLSDLTAATRNVGQVSMVMEEAQ